VGGSTGTTAIALAQAFSHLSFVVQDLPANAESGEKALSESQPEDIKSRIRFQGHNFTQPQPVKGANIYLLRMILHDWPDNEAITIIRNIAAAMDPSVSRLLIMDTVLPKPGSVPVSVERISRARDMTMLQCFNSKERHLEDWESLLKATELGVELVGVTQPFGSAMSVMEVRLASGPASNSQDSTS
jgi:6-hydroxytryprostatin B O-methyltransferase